MSNCVTVPFKPEDLFCYPELYLSYYDKLFIFVISAALVAVFVSWWQGVAK